MDGHTHFSGDFFAVQPEGLGAVRLCCLDDCISQKHAELIVEAETGIVSLRDCGSQNGTSVRKGSRYSKKTYAELRPLDRFRCGRTEFTIVEIK